MVGFWRRVGLDALSRRFADTVAAPLAGAHPGAPVVVGVEHEYRVLRDGERVPFDALLADLDLGRRYLDPADANAVRLESGSAVTCDEGEAELALPPVPVRPGFVQELLTRVAADEARLHERLRASSVELVGVSTHVSVSVDAPLDTIDRVARLYAQSFAPALMLLLDRADSWGVFVRPRPGRLELCGEFARGERLGAVATFAAGTVRACLDVVEGRALASTIPPRLRLRVAPATGRFGYTVWRTAGIGDLYAAGRAARLPRPFGPPTTGQAQLEAAWCSARAALPMLAPEDVAPVEHFVTGAFPLPVVADPIADSATPDPDGAPGEAAWSPFGRLAHPVPRPGFEMAPVMLAWPVVVLVAAALPSRRRAFVCVPRPALDSFVSGLQAGALDEIVRAYLAASPRGRRLERHDQTQAPGLYDELGRRRALLPAEPAGPGPRLRVR